MIDAMKQAMYLIEAWERGAYAEEYPNEIDALRQAIEQAEKQEPVAYIDPVSGKPKFINGYVVQTDYDISLYTAPPRKERELEQAIREERGRCHQLVWDYGFSKVGNNDVQEACATLAKRILAMGKK